MALERSRREKKQREMDARIKSSQQGENVKA